MDKLNLIKMLTSMITGMKSNWLSSVLTCLVVVSTLFNIQSTSDVRGISKKLGLSSDGLSHEELMVKRFEANASIIDILSAASGEMTSIDRIMVFEYHNGLENVTGLPFNKFTVTYEIQADNTPAYHKPFYTELQNLNTSIFKFVNHLYSTERVRYTTLEMRKIDYNMYNILVTHNINELYLCNLTHRGQIIGFVAIVSDKELAADDIIITMEIAPQIASLLYIKNNHNDEK